MYTYTSANRGLLVSTGSFCLCYSFSRMFKVNRKLPYIHFYLFNIFVVHILQRYETDITLDASKVCCSKEWLLKGIRNS